MDNASSCDVLARTVGKILLDRYHINFHEDNNRARCLAHVVNLVVQSILASLGEAKDPDDDDNFLSNKSQPFHFDADNDEDVLAMENEVYDEDEEVEDSDEQIDEIVEEAMKQGSKGKLSAVKKVSREQLNLIYNIFAHPFVCQLRAIVTKIVSSPQRRSSFRKASAEKYKTTLGPSGKPIANLMVIKDVATRWNYTHAMIQRGLLLRKVNHQ